MKQLAIQIACAVLLQTAILGVNIDPRQYLSIVEIRPGGSDTAGICLYDYHSAKNSMGRGIVDKDSRIEITFAQDSLAANTDFIGNISLTAQIGNRDIEVTPYSNVGREQKRVGVDARPAKEIASTFAGFMAQSKTLNGNIGRIEGYFNQLNYDEYGRLILDARAFFDDSARKNDTFNIDSAAYINVKNNLIRISDIESDGAKLTPCIQKTKRYTYGELYGILDGISGRFNSDKKKHRSDAAVATTMDNYRQQIRATCANMQLASSYLEYFTAASTETQAAFLTLAGIDAIAISDFRARLRRATDNLRYIDTLSEITTANTKPALRANLPMLRDCLVRILSAYGSSNTKSILKDDDGPMRQERINEIARMAGRIIYRGLVKATIDLPKAGAREGDELAIAMQWSFNSSPSASDSQKAIPLPVGTYRIKETGTRAKVYDSFLLIKRFTMNAADSNSLPSNFKGAPGASLMWTYGHDGRSGSWFKRAEPSWGVNVSYLDFYRNKDIEIGAGLAAGLFRNRLFAVWGYNLNSEDRREGVYWGLGFSFSQLAGSAR